MQGIVQAIAGKLGIDEATVGAAVTVLLQLVQQHADSGPASEFFAKLPGAQALLAGAEAPVKAAGDPAGGLGGAAGGGLGGLMGSVGGALGDKLGGGLGAFAQLQASGLDSDQVGPLVGQFIDFAKEHAGEDLANQVMSSIPGLQDIVG